MYKSLKVSFATWQALTRISAATGEPRSQIIDRLAQDEEQRVTNTERNTGAADRGDEGATKQ
jgi:macrodomain Ter protein organizer (MatP/YcbG family)